jgi:hypothetical protein
LRWRGCVDVVLRLGRRAAQIDGSRRWRYNGQRSAQL